MDEFEQVTPMRFVPAFGLPGNYVKIAYPCISVSSFNRYFEDFAVEIPDGTFDLRTRSDTRTWKGSLKNHGT